MLTNIAAVTAIRAESFPMAESSSFSSVSSPSFSTGAIPLSGLVPGVGGAGLSPPVGGVVGSLVLDPPLLYPELL